MYQKIYSWVFVVLGLFIVLSAFVSRNDGLATINSIRDIAESPLDIVRLIIGLVIIFAGCKRACAAPVPKVFVREIVTDSIALIFVILFAYLLYRNSLNPGVQVSPILISIVSIIIGYYFGKTFKK